MQPYWSLPRIRTYRLELGAAQPEPQSAPKPACSAPKPACFRISGIPPSWDSSGRLEEELQTIDPDFDRTAAEVSGPFPDIYGSSTQTALLNLSKCTSYFTFEPGQEKHEMISENGEKFHLVLDEHFYDLTPLNRAEEPIQIDVIAITGLGGHAFGAWQSRISTKRPIDRPMWLRDFLPRVFPNARIMTYGYHSSPAEPNGANMTDYRRGFIQCLHNSRRGCPERPIAFIGHGLGGILVVQALIEARNLRRDLCESIRCVFFFGTPHQGFVATELEKAVGDKTDRQGALMLSQLKEGSEYLENQQEALGRLWGEFDGKVVTFYETKPTGTRGELAPGSFERGEEAQMVQRLSAQLYLPGESRHPLHSNHTDLVKFDSPQGSAFQTVVTTIREVIGTTTSRNEILELLIPSEKLLDTECEETSTRYGHTFEWFWESPEYNNWLSTEGSSFLFIEGKPACGKSTLLRFLTDHFNPQVNGAIVAKFFYSDRDGELESHKTMLRHLLHEILKKDESFFMHFQREYRNLKNPEADQPPKAWEYGKLKAVLRACLEHPQNRSFFLIIDAMDKSDDGDRVDIVNFLREFSSPAKATGCVVKVLIASRPINEIRYSSIPVIQRIRLQERNGGDIWEYIHQLVKKEVLSSYSDGDRKKIMDYIIKHADGVFLWVHVVCCELEKYCRKGASRGAVFGFLESLPKELEGYYERVLQGLKGDGDVARGGTRILQFCLFSHRAMELLELRDALGIPGEIPLPSLGSASLPFEIDGPKDIRSWLTSCVGGFLEIKNIPGFHSSVFVLLINLDSYPQDMQVGEREIAQVMHQTVREFFLRPHKSVIESHFQNNVSERPARKMIAITCIGYLGLHYKELENNFHGVAGARVSAWDLEDLLELVHYLDSRPLIKYSLEYLALLKEDENIDPDIREPFSDLTINIQNCPSPLQTCLLGRLTNLRTDAQRLQDLNSLLEIAARCGYTIAVGNLLAAGAGAGAEYDAAARGGRQATVRDQAADMSAENHDWPIPLHLGAQDGHRVAGRRLTEKGADASAANQGRRTPLHFAAQNRDETVARPVIGRGTGISATNRRGRALHFAARGGHAAAARLLIGGDAGVSASNQDGRTPLHSAVQNGQGALARRLIEEGAEISATNQGGQTPLHCAAWHGHRTIARLLIEKGADVSAANKDGRTPLHSAAQNGHEMIARMLIEMGADVSALSQDGRTPLHFAAQNGQEAVARLFIEKGADVLAANWKGRTPLHSAAWNGQVAVARLLIEEGADVSDSNQDGRTPLSFATQNGQEAVAQLLIEMGADVSVAYQDGRTPLHFSAQNGQVTVARLLIERGADISAATQDGHTPLHFAAQNGHEAVTRLLINECADVSAENQNGWTPLRFAAQNGHETVARLLTEKGAGTSALNQGGQTAPHSAVNPDRQHPLGWP